MFFALFFQLLTVFCSAAVAQQATETTELTGQKVEQLKELVGIIATKREARDAVRVAIKKAAADEVPEIQKSLDQINADIQETRLALEQIAIGSVDLASFEDESNALDWRAELSQVMLPVMQNLKRITEKPRKIEILKSKISRSTTQKISAEIAASNISAALEVSEDTATNEALTQLQESWLQKSDELEREISLALVQLENLQRGDGPLWTRIRDSLTSFFTGRGLTLLLAAGAAFVVHFVAQLLEKLFSKRQKGEDVKAFRTRERIAHYALKAAKSLFILIIIMVVFYLRGDILLMALALLIIAGLVLSLRNTIPKFVDELRLLLNLGSIREDERVIYAGLPWKVSKLNVYSLLTNPEITGVQRIPIQEMISLTSRPAGNEPWFPTSRGDYILFDDGRLLQITKITPEHVLMDSLAGTKTMVPTAEFYTMVFENLSRSPTFSVNSVFGVGYLHQAESNDRIPEKLKQAIEKELNSTDLGDQVVSVSVELQEAGASSLDFWLGVKMKSGAATSYFKIKRIIQQVCVATCTAENWDIPFPQLTLHNN